MGVQEYLLHSFAAFAAQRANRLSMLRVFARFAQAEDVGHEVPSERVFSVRGVRYRPFIFTSDQLHDLLVRAAKLPPAGPMAVAGSLEISFASSRQLSVPACFLPVAFPVKVV